MGGGVTFEIGRPRSGGWKNFGRRWTRGVGGPQNWRIFMDVIRVSSYIGFTIFHLSEAATGGVLLEKVFLEISQNSQENTYRKVSFLITLQAEATASGLSPVFS